ncbi:MAG: hypothetical protein ACRCUT_03350, partial [Spirochaetota bacterium]
MKKILILCIALGFILPLRADTKQLKDLIRDGKWYNDEYSFSFTSSMLSKKYKAYYTFGSVNGSMTGTFEISGDRAVTIKKGDIEGLFDAAFMPGGELRLVMTADPQNPKAMQYLHDADDKIVLWNDKSFVPENKKITLGGAKVPCVTLGYKLNATTDNVRIRKGPGTDFEYMTFYYKEQSSDKIKSSGSVLSGTNIRVLARTEEKMKVNEWYNYWYYIEYKEPKGNLLSYKTAWMFGEFINVPENKDRQITVTGPENEDSYYGEYRVTV